MPVGYIVQAAGRHGAVLRQARGHHELEARGPSARLGLLLPHHTTTTSQNPQGTTFSRLSRRVGGGAHRASEGSWSSETSSTSWSSWKLQRWSALAPTHGRSKSPLGLTGLLLVSGDPGGSFETAAGPLADLGAHDVLVEIQVADLVGDEQAAEHQPAREQVRHAHRERRALRAL